MHSVFAMRNRKPFVVVLVLLLAWVGLNVPAHKANAIVGGSTATAAYPSMVSVQESFGNGLTGYCGGTVVASSWVLTAAHCVTSWVSEGDNSQCEYFLQIRPDNKCRLFATKARVDLPQWKVAAPSRFTVIAGRSDLTRTDVGSSIKVTQVAVAPYFQPILHVAAPGFGCPVIAARCEGVVSFESLSGDIALLHLATPLTSVTPIPLADVAKPLGTSVQVIGWGDTDPSTKVSLSPVLKQSTDGALSIIGTSACIPAEAATYVLPNQLICVGGNGKTGTGGGDSGGPLLAKAADGSLTQIGVVSYGPDNPEWATNKNPDAFTSVTANLAYIRKVIGAAPGGTGSGKPIDLVLAVDTTGSMSPYINSVVSSASSVVDTLAASGASFRVAVVDYKDSDNCGDYDAKLDLPFSGDHKTITDAIAALASNVSGGCDIPEDVYSGVDLALSQPWRTGVTKAVIQMGDAPGKDPEPHSGLTLAKVAAHAQAVDPAQIYPILVGGDDSAHTFATSLATATAGKVFDATADPSAAGPAFVKAVQAISSLTATKTGLALPSSAIASVPTRLTARVTPTPDLGEGTVTFAADGNPVSGCQDVPVSTTGIATCDATFATSGTLSLSAAFSGDAELDKSASPKQDLMVKDEPRSTMSLLVTDMTGKVLSTVTAAPGHVRWHVSASGISVIVTRTGARLSLPFIAYVPANPSARRIIYATTADGRFAGFTGSASKVGTTLVGESTGTWKPAKGPSVLVHVNWVIGAPSK